MSFELIVDPDRFFQRQLETDDLRGPVSVVALLGVVGGLTAIYLAVRATSNLEGGAGVVTAITTFVVALTAMVLPFILWLAFSLVLYVGTLAFDGNGSFRRTFRLLGWGFVPRLLSAVIVAGATVVAAQTVPAPETAEHVARFRTAVNENSIRTTARVLHSVFVLWSGFLWMFALKHARRITLLQAAVISGILTTVLIAWNLWQVL